MAFQPPLLSGDPDMDMAIALVGTVNPDSLCFVAWPLHY